MIAALFWISVFLMVYTYACYPLLIALLAKLRRPRKRIVDELPSVTLLVAAYNEQDVISEKIEDSLRIDYPVGKLQILVAADGSSDATPRVVEGYRDRGVELSFAAPRQGKLSAIINALRLARGDIVIVTDANNRFSSDAVRRLVEPYTDPRVGAVGGAKHIVQDGAGLSASEGLYWKYESFIKRQESRLGTCISMPGEILSFRKHLVDPPSCTVIMDDIFMAMQVLRKGYNIAYQPLAKSFEPVSPSARDEFERRARNVAGRYEAVRMIPLEFFFRRPVVMWQYVSHKVFRLLLPFAMVGALVANIWLVCWPSQQTYLGMSRPLAIGCLLLQFLFYGLAWVGGRVKLGGFLGKLLYFPAFLVASNLAGLAGFLRHITRRQTATWQRVARKRS